MPIEEMTDAELLTAQRELLQSAQTARANDDFDTAQRYLRMVRPMNVEMLARIHRSKIRLTVSVSV